MSETKAENIARRISEVRASVGKPGECWCIGWCDNGRHPERCPAHGHAKKTFNELMEPMAHMAELVGDADRAAAYRAAMDPA